MDDSRAGDARRVLWSDGMPLEARVFEAERASSQGQRERDRRDLVGAGILGSGLAVELAGPLALRITPGRALDAEGRELRLLETRELRIEPEQGAGTLVIGLVHRESRLAEDELTWLLEGCGILAVSVDEPPAGLVELARVSLAAGWSALREPRDPRAPGVCELDRRFARRIELGEVWLEASRLRLGRAAKDARRALWGLARGGVVSALELRGELRRLESGIAAGRWDRRRAEVERGLLAELVAELAEEWSGAAGGGLQRAAREALGRVEDGLRGRSGGEGGPVEALCRAAEDLADLAAILSRLWSAAGTLGEDGPTGRFPELSEDLAVEDELRERSLLPETIILDDRVFRMVDEVALLDELSEAEHELRVVEGERAWAETRTLRYPNGEAVSARGRLMKGGSLSWSVRQLELARDVLLVLRVDCRHGEVGAALAVAGDELGAWSLGDAQAPERWRNESRLVEASRVTGESLPISLRVPAGVTLGCYGLWAYQADEG